MTQPGRPTPAPAPDTPGWVSHLSARLDQPPGTGVGGGGSHLSSLHVRLTGWGAGNRRALTGSRSLSQRSPRPIPSLQMRKLRTPDRARDLAQVPPLSRSPRHSGKLVLPPEAYGPPESLFPTLPPHQPEPGWLGVSPYPRQASLHPDPGQAVQRVILKLTSDLSLRCPGIKSSLKAHNQAPSTHIGSSRGPLRLTDPRVMPDPLPGPSCTSVALLKLFPLPGTAFLLPFFLSLPIILQDSTATSRKPSQIPPVEPGASSGLRWPLRVPPSWQVPHWDVTVPLAPVSSPGLGAP